MSDKGFSFSTRGGPRVVVQADTEACPCIMVLFGATGDLSLKKLFPALYRLERDHMLPWRFHLVGFSRSGRNTDVFRGLVADSLRKNLKDREWDDAVWKRFSARVEYVAGTFSKPESMSRLGDKLGEIEAKFDTRLGQLYFMASPPSSFKGIVEGLDQAGLLHRLEKPGDPPWSRVVIEKPFGSDYDSAVELNRVLSARLDEEQIFRVDHFLAKETVQNILVLRFGNSIFEPVWNSNFVDHVQITAAESFGIAERGAFYEETGVIRDVFQNHLLQILALVGMEPPISFRAEDISDQKTHLFRSLRAFHDPCLVRRVVLGQYEGYTGHKGVPGDSRVPTYAALEVLIDNWRWKGVPFFLRSGKQLARSAFEVAIQFKQIPACLFGGIDLCKQIKPNVLCLRIQPDEGITLEFVAKVPGDEVRVGHVTMDFSYARGFDGKPREAYERLFLDAMRGDKTLFATPQEIELEWKYVMPIISGWEQGKMKVSGYGQGGEGPEAAAEMIGKENKRMWRPL